MLAEVGAEPTPESHHDRRVGGDLSNIHGHTPTSPVTTTTGEIAPRSVGRNMSEDDAVSQLESGESVSKPRLSSCRFQE